MAIDDNADLVDAMNMLAAGHAVLACGVMVTALWKHDQPKVPEGHRVNL